MSGPEEEESKEKRPVQVRRQEGHPPEAPLVLIVEDEPAIANMIEALLQDEGYRTLRAETGRQAEELAHGYHPDLVILDLYLPDKEGVEVLYELKSSPDTASIPIIVESAYTLLLAPEDMLRLAEVIPKPFDVESLLNAVKRALKTRATALASDHNSGQRHGQTH